MTNTDDQSQLALALPGEWAIKKVFGPVIGEVGEDIKKLYAAGRDKIIIAGYRKIANKEDGKLTNLRVARDVFMNGSFTDEEICAEYFGGILASSRSVDGKDDVGVYYVDLIKSLSSNQLKLHYLIYITLNKILVNDPSKSNLNPGQENELISEKVFLSTEELLQIIGKIDIGRDLHAIHAKGLIEDFETNAYKLKNGDYVPYMRVTPSSLGIQLYAVAHNRLSEWRKFSTLDLGDFHSFSAPKFRGKNMDDLLVSAHILDLESTNKNS